MMLPRTSIDRGYYPPTIHPDDAKTLQNKGVEDVRFVDWSETGLVLGEDLVLFVRNESEYERSRWLTGVCDASANHLAILAITPDYPSDAVLTAAIATAKAAYPGHVRIPAEDKAGTR